ncbi:MAG: isoprenylcysteine carboxylmethyltransferase family protein [Caulobacterales bacterium]|nr:isoprenylcysteine carboxylmethyltransferase family protein [Caulobacterales bacterium]
MGRILAAAYGVICYLIFLATFLYAIAFVGDFLVPRTIDAGGPVAPLVPALLVNVVLLGVFAVQHSLMARPEFKRVWTRIVPEPIERSTYVLFSNAALILLYWQWRPMPDAVWALAEPVTVNVVRGLFWIGWGIVLASTFMISHFELFGLRQIWLNLRQEATPVPSFRTPMLYGFVRHPIYLGFIIAFWAAPVMSQGHLLFAVMTTAYMLIAIQLEERDLIGVFGDTYRQYRQKVGMLIPMPKKGG